MTTIQKRFVFCACGGAIGAVLAFQFQSLWWLITALSGLTGWIMADAEGFFGACRVTCKKASQQIWSSVIGFGKQLGEDTQSRRPVFWRFTRLVFFYVASVTIQMFFSFFVFLLAFAIIFNFAPDDKFYLEPITELVHLVITSVLIGLTCATILTVVITVEISKRLSLQELFNGCRLTREGLRDINPLVWIPKVITITIRFLTKHLLNLLRLAHSDERTVCAICFAGGTVLGFIAGRSAGLSQASGLVALAVGALSGFGIAWLDWKILSLRLGWRTATDQVPKV